MMKARRKAAGSESDSLSEASSSGAPRRTTLPRGLFCNGLHVCCGLHVHTCVLESETCFVSVPVMVGFCL